MRLEPCNSRYINNGTASDIAHVFSDTKLMGEFVILNGDQDGDFIQTAGEGDDGYCLEYRVETTGEHFQAERTVTRAEAKQAFQDYLAGNDRWRTGRQWLDMNMRGSGCRTPTSLLVAALILAGLAAWSSAA